MDTLFNPLTTSSFLYSENDFPLSWMLVIKNFLGPILSLSFVSLLFWLVNLYFVHKTGSTQLTTAGVISLGIMIILVPQIVAFCITYNTNLHFSLDDKFFTLNYGVFTKKRSQTSYANIQDCLIIRDSLDKVFGLAGIRLVLGQNGSQVSASPNTSQTLTVSGFSKNHAEQLRAVFLDRAKKSRIQEVAG